MTRHDIDRDWYCTDCHAHEDIAPGESCVFDDCDFAIPSVCSACEGTCRVQGRGPYEIVCPVCEGSGGANAAWEREQMAGVA